QTFDPKTGEPVTNYDAGGQIDHARNDLKVKVAGAQLRTKYIQNANTDFEVGLKLEKEKLRDFTNEWQLIDSLGYNYPRPNLPPGVLDPSDLKLRYAINANNSLDASRLSAYGQYSKKLMWKENKVFVNAGIRMQHWSFNDQTIVSPRAQFAIKPKWKTDMLFRLSGGAYYQAPFYKEIKNLDGSFNPDIRAQKSFQLIAGNDYEFIMAKRPFKLTTELYYKGMSDLIPYYIENVRVRYTGKNNATGYSYGIDTRLFGEFVPGVDSWISASYARSYENIDNRGDIPRPTDQRFRFSLFYQDYMPKFPTMRVNLTAVYASGLPNGAPLLQDPYQYTRTLPAYKRVDIGLSKVFVDAANRPNSRFLDNFKEMTLGVQIFNAFNISNTVANQWIADVQSTRAYPVPVRLTGRFFNVKLEFKL
ncbi:MAG: TonB-dependent receptor, partial [Chryseobacterium sp.]